MPASTVSVVKTLGGVIQTAYDERGVVVDLLETSPLVTSHAAIRLDLTRACELRRHLTRTIHLATKAEQESRRLAALAAARRS